jgi:hypothetical protein
MGSAAQFNGFYPQYLRQYGWNPVCRTILNKGEIMGFSDLKCEHCRNIIKKDEAFYMFSEKHDRIDFYSLCNECGKKVREYYNRR